MRIEKLRLRLSKVSSLSSSLSGFSSNKHFTQLDYWNLVGLVDLVLDADEAKLAYQKGYYTFTFITFEGNVVVTYSEENGVSVIL